MKLPLALPKLSLPFIGAWRRRRAAADDEEAVAAPEESGDGLSAAPEDRPRGNRASRRSRVVGILRGVVTAIAVVVPVGGLGATVGWLVVNADRTTAARVALQPVLEVPILEPGEAPSPNASQNARIARASASRPGQEPEQAGHRPDTEQGAGGPAKDQAGPGAGPSASSTFQLVDPALIEESDKGRLPIVAADGRRAMDVYARPFDAADRRPRLAIVISMLGLSARLTERAIQLLPGEVTLSFAPYAAGLTEWVTAARRDGHEVLIDLPMEPIGFPASDPGPDTLLTSLSAVENLNRLESVLGKSGGYVGVLGFAGSRFTVVEESLNPVLTALQERGLLFVDSRASSRSLASELAASLELPRAFNNRFLDTSPSAADIDRQLEELERIARASRAAVGVGHAYPVTIERVSAWLATLEGKGIALAPITAVADRQSLR